MGWLEKLGLRKPKPLSVLRREAFFGRRAIVCEQCRAVYHSRGEPFAVAPCPSCGFSNFIPKHIADFMLFEPAGAGGLASVYKAWKRNAGDSLFAVKLLRPEERRRPDSVAAFVREAEIHRCIPPHPHLVRYEDGGQRRDEFYYAMEFVEGRRLKSRLDNGEKVPESEALGIAEELLCVLQHIYNHGFLYRDISAGNIIQRSNGHIVLIDFGLTLTVEEAAAIDNPDNPTVEGTAEFLPPERVWKMAEDPASVLYSVGMLMFYMLRGEPYLKASTMEEQARRHVSSLRIAVSPQLIPEASPATVAFIERLADPDWEARYPTFEAALEVLRETCPLAPSNAPPPC